MTTKRLIMTRRLPSAVIASVRSDWSAAQDDPFLHPTGYPAAAQRSRTWRCLRREPSDVPEADSGLAPERIAAGRDPAALPVSSLSDLERMLEATRRSLELVQHRLHSGRSYTHYSRPAGMTRWRPQSASVYRVRSRRRRFRLSSRPSNICIGQRSFRGLLALRSSWQDRLPA